MKASRVLRIISLLVMLACILPPICVASDVSLAWDASTSDGVEGYIILERNYAKVYPNLPTSVSISPGTTALVALQAVFTEAAYIGNAATLTCTVSNIVDDRQHAFVALAFAQSVADLDGNATVVFSGYSNEVVYTPDSTPVEPPTLNWVQRIIAAVLDFFGPSFAQSFNINLKTVQTKG